MGVAQCEEPEGLPAALVCRIAAAARGACAAKPRSARATAARQTWRKQLDLTQEGAALLLDCSRSQVANWDAGVERSRGKPAVPPRAVRVLMTLEAQGQTVTPWPEK